MDLLTPKNTAGDRFAIAFLGICAFAWTACYLICFTNVFQHHLGIPRFAAHVIHDVSLWLLFYVTVIGIVSVLLRKHQKRDVLPFLIGSTGSGIWLLACAQLAFGH
jgi:hypothetical protein